MVFNNTEFLNKKSHFADFIGSQWLRVRELAQYSLHMHQMTTADSGQNQTTTKVTSKNIQQPSEH